MTDKFTSVGRRQLKRIAAKARVAELDKRERAFFYGLYGWKPPRGANLKKWLAEARIKDDQIWSTTGRSALDKRQG